MARGLAWGDIRMVEFATPDKMRPVVVVTRTSAIAYLDAVSVIPITSTLRGVPTQVVLGVDEGLKGPSAANLHAIQTVPKERIGRYLGALSPSRKDELRRALLFAYDLD